MKLISHRGNLNGIEPDKENTLEAIDKCLSFGFDVMVDVWYDNSNWFLGTLGPSIPVSWTMLNSLKNNLWMNARTVETFLLLKEKLNFKTFFNANGTFGALTSDDVFWLSPSKDPGLLESSLQCNCIFHHRIDDTDDEEINFRLQIVTNKNFLYSSYYAICSDYPQLFQSQSI